MALFGSSNTTSGTSTAFGGVGTGGTFGSSSSATANNGTGTGTGAGTGGGSGIEVNSDVELSDPPSDSVSSLAWSSVGEYLALGSWNNEVRIYEVNPSNLASQGRAMHAHQGPVLGVTWNKEGNKVFSGGADNAGRCYDLQAMASSQVAAHEAPIKTVRWVETPQGGLLATGSWDKTIKYWDLRQQTPVLSVNLPERCYAMDVVYPLMVVATAERHIQIFNLANPATPIRTILSPLKWQTRVVTCFPSADGFAIGSVEGRVAIQYADEGKSSQNYSFRCHRKEQAPNQKDQMLVYAVNDINFHPVHGTFSTSGSDGTFSFWDKDARSRLKNYGPFSGSIVSSAFNRTGDFFAYAMAYDWSKGYTGMTNGYPNKVMMHVCKPEEVRKRSAR